MPFGTMLAAFSGLLGKSLWTGEESKWGELVCEKVISLDKMCLN